MSQWLPLLIEGLGMSKEYIVLLVFIFGNLITYAKDFKIGLMLQFIGSGVIFIIFYSVGWNWMPPAVIFILSLIMLALSLFAVKKSVDAGEVI